MTLLNFGLIALNDDFQAMVHFPEGYFGYYPHFQYPGTI